GRREIAAVQRVLAGVDTRQDGVRITRIARERDRNDEQRAIVDVLAVQREPAAFELAAEAHAKLTALVSPVARIPNAVRDAIEAADAEGPLLADRSAPEAVGAVIAVVANRQPNVCFGSVGRLAGDEIDRAADGAVGKNRRRAAAHDLDAAHGPIDAHELIRIVKRQLITGIDRDAVLHQPDVAIAAVLYDAAGEDVALRRARRRF